jgi:hypothetical protein
VKEKVPDYAGFPITRLPAGRANKSHAGKTHCLRGHEYDAANTMLQSTKPGFFKRRCRKCKNESAQRRAREQRGGG